MYLLRRGGLLAGAVLLAGSLVGSPAQAQSAICPTGFPGQTGVVFQLNSCTNNITGAYSNTALASQSLGEFSQSSTQDATKATMASISNRRTSEEQRCPDGSTRVGGTCKPVASRFAEEPPLGGTWMSMPAALLAFGPLKPASAAEPVAPGPRMAVWTQAYGDYERLTGKSRGLGEFSVLALEVKSTNWSGGVLGGVDTTFRNVAFGGDGVIAGVLAGYESSRLSINTSSISSDPTSPSGFSTMKALLSGPATGVYASYFNGGFSTDLAFKAEFLDLNVSFNDLLGFQSNPAVGFPPTTVPFSGSGTTRLNNYTTSGNVNYRFPAGANVWVEPTTGFQYTRSDFASDAALLGLADGSLLRVQGGARFGVESSWNAIRMTTVVTGLLYDDVSVTGGVLQSGGNPLILSDEGKLRAEGILALNFYHGNSVTSFLQVDVQGGEGLFGAGGKMGLRVAW
jgi:Autotransporter beta-domain